MSNRSQSSPNSRAAAKRRSSSSEAKSRIARSLVLVASADPDLRRWWERRLDGEYAVEKVEQAAGIRPALLRSRPSVMLLDSLLPSLGGVKVVRAFSRLSPSTRIVVLSDGQDPREAVAALKSGAHGYCYRHVDSRLARKTIETVQKGELWINRQVTLTLLRELLPLHQATRNAEDGTDPLLRPLTPRERDVAHLVAAGARNKDIAASLDITEATVKAHLTAIFRKLGIPDRLRLALMLTSSSEGSKSTRARSSKT